VALFTLNQGGSGTAAEISGEFKATAGVVTTNTAASYSPDPLAEAGEIIDCNLGSAQTVNLPEGPAEGTTYLIIQRGAGVVTINAQGADSVNGAGSVDIANRYSGATVIYVASHIWAAVGDL
jgi:hypothetical protein